jgi:CRISPR-associated endonuclease Csn1
MPRFGVCKAEDALYQEFHLNKSIHNIRVVKEGESLGRKITHSEFTELRSEFLEKKKATEKQLEKALAKMQLKFEGNAYPLEAAKTGGRSSFCRPALRILNELLISGKSPHAIFDSLKNRHRAAGHDVSVCDNTEPTKGLVLADLNWLTKVKHLNWSEFYLPQERYDAALNAQNKDEGIRQTMANLNNPVVRHRVQLFVKTLREMNAFISSKYSAPVPNSVALEFVRDDFLGAKAKKDLQAFQKNRRNENEQAKKRAEELGLAGYRATRKVASILTTCAILSGKPKLITAKLIILYLLNSADQMLNTTWFLQGEHTIKTRLFALRTPGSIATRACGKNMYSILAV